MGQLSLPSPCLKFINLNLEYFIGKSYEPLLSQNNFCHPFVRPLVHSLQARHVPNASRSLPINLVTPYVTTLLSSFLHFWVGLTISNWGPHSSYKTPPLWLQHLMPHLERTDNKPFIGLWHMTTSRAAAHQPWVARYSLTFRNLANKYLNTTYLVFTFQRSWNSNSNDSLLLQFDRLEDSLYTYSLYTYIIFSI